MAISIHFVPTRAGVGEPAVSPTPWFQPAPELVRRRVGRKGTVEAIVLERTAEGFVLRGALIVAPPYGTWALPVDFVRRQAPHTLPSAIIDGPHVIRDAAREPAAADITREELVGRGVDNGRVAVSVDGRAIAVVTETTRRIAFEDRGRRIEEMGCEPDSGEIEWTVRRIHGRLTAIAFLGPPHHRGLRRVRRG